MVDTNHGVYNTQPAGLEKVLDETFRQKAPFHLPEGFIKWVANNSWWLVLVSAVISLLSVVTSLNTINQLAVTSTYLDAYGLGTSEQAKNLLYVSMLSSVVSAVLMFMASPKLKMHLKAGWNLLYYNFLISLVLGLISYIVFSTSTLIASLIGLGIGFVIGAYLLFQLRTRFTK